MNRNHFFMLGTVLLLLWHHDLQGGQPDTHRAIHEVHRPADGDRALRAASRMPPLYRRRPLLSRPGFDSHSSASARS